MRVIIELLTFCSNWTGEGEEAISRTTETEGTYKKHYTNRIKKTDQLARSSLHLLLITPDLCLLFYRNPTDKHPYSHFGR